MGVGMVIMEIVKILAGIQHERIDRNRKGHKYRYKSNM
jgi:hypothetical protein